MAAVMSNFAQYVVKHCEYAYVTVYDSKTGDVLCEGIASSVRREYDYCVLPIKLFKIFEAEDGGVFLDIYA